MPEPEYTTFHVHTDDGLRLYGRIYGADGGDRLPIVCLSGLSRNSRDFHLFARRLAAEDRRVVTLDYRGRGHSDWDANTPNYNIVREAQDVVLTLDTLGIERAAFVGTSRGGLILHVLGTMIANRIAAVVFNDIGPVIEAEGLRHIRDYLTTGSQLTDLAAAVSHLRFVHGEEFPALSNADWHDMADAIYRDLDGRLVADFDPALVEPLKTMDFSSPLPDLWPQFARLAEIPILIVRGENSRLLSPQTVKEMLARHPGALSVIARGQGHAPILHLDDPYASIAAFLHSH